MSLIRIDWCERCHDTFPEDSRLMREETCYSCNAEERICENCSWGSEPGEPYICHACWETKENFQVIDDPEHQT